jgi:hypothetical protein
VTGNKVSDKLDKDLAALDKEYDEIGGPANEAHPSLKQYRKLKRVMTSITGFYENGTRKKGENYEQMVWWWTLRYLIGPPTSLTACRRCAT